MTPEPSRPADREEQLQDILAGYLERLEAGRAEDREALLARSPEFAADLAEFFGMRDQVDGVAVPLRQAVLVGPPPAGPPSGDTDGNGDLHPPARATPLASALEAAVAGKVAEIGQLGDFRLLREVGRGGMGIVYEAEQISLGRRVALKVLPFAATMDPRQLQRFHNEARAAASLEHPHIVPVYGVGCERSVHYYAMKFIDGQSLDALLHELRQPATPTLPQTPPSPTDPTTDEPAAGSRAAATVEGRAEPTERTPLDAGHFRRVAEWGVQAAEALEHAHALGVVHRDVKPGNLLLDGQGKLWVTDFGLARTAANSGLTMTGDLVGTLRYMSPEQALAKRVVIDHRTDVYSLGATLYELLTLRPAFRGNDQQELLRQIAFEDPQAPRRIDKDIPAELETIALKALEKNPQERYATAQELADDLRRWLEDRPIQARRPSVLQRARKWARRHRAVVWATAAVLLVVLLLGGALLWREQRQRAAVERVVEANLERAKLLQEQERWDEALAVLTVAEGQLEGRALGTLRERVEQRKRDVDMLTRLENARLQPAEVGPGKGGIETSRTVCYAEAFARYGLSVATLGLEKEEAAERVRASEISTRLIAALDDWTALSMGSWGSGARGEPMGTVVDLADDDPWRRRLRGAAWRWDQAALEKLAEEKGTWSQSPAHLVFLARVLEKADRWEAAERLLRRAQQEHPADFVINFELADILQKKKLPDPAEAVGFYRAALALRAQSPVVWNNLGNVLRAQGKLAEAEAAYRQAIKRKPDLAEARHHLGIALQVQGKLQEAEAAHRKALDLSPADETYVRAYVELGDAFRDQGKPAEAEAVYRKALALRPDLAQSYFSSGLRLADQGKPAEAEAAFRKAIRLEADPAKAHYYLGVAHAKKGQLDEAIKAYREAIRRKKDYADAHIHLGNALVEQKKLDQAVAAFRRAEQLLPNNPVIRNNVRVTERWLELDRQLPAILAGKVKPGSSQQRVERALFCVLYKERYHAAVGFFTDAFTAESKLADDLQAQHRYNAGCAAALAGCGQGKDAEQSDVKERGRLRRQALAWLRADLAAYRRLLEKEPDKAGVVRQRMQHWQQDKDFAGVRGPEALAKLPNAAERQEWQQLWHEVEALRQRAAGAPR